MRACSLVRRTFRKTQGNQRFPVPGKLLFPWVRSKHKWLTAPSRGQYENYFTTTLDGFTILIVRIYRAAASYADEESRSSTLVV